MKNIYKITIACLTLALANPLLAQKNVGIGTTSPDNSAVLEIKSIDKGLLIPRMTQSDRDAILNPADGLMIYQTNNSSGFYYFSGSQKGWSPISAIEAKSIAADPNDWTNAGNSGLNHNTNFLGTTDNVPFAIKVSNQRVIFTDINFGNTSPYGYSGTGSVFVGLGSGVLNTGRFNVGIGTNSLGKNTTGIYNTAIGFQALSKNTTSNSNVSIGNFAMLERQTGDNNIAIGNNSLQNNNGGVLNMALGTFALQSNTTGNNNIAIGRSAGLNNNGSSNLFLGTFAGANESGSNKLYVANTNTATPLIYGDFSAKYVTIGDVTPALRSQGVATGGYNLLVKGGILTEKVKVALAAAGTDWADYVFEPNYKLMTLEEVESFTKENKHLPNVPSADEMVNSGLDVAQTSKMFMEKIEELTLYMIELNKEVKSLKAENEVLKDKLR